MRRFVRTAALAALAAPLAWQEPRVISSQPSPPAEAVRPDGGPTRVIDDPTPWIVYGRGPDGPHERRPAAEETADPPHGVVVSPPGHRASTLLDSLAEECGAPAGLTEAEREVWLIGYVAGLRAR